MKILRLALNAFGPFTDAALDLSEGREGLHLIYGPNEAGKSSSLRAIRHVFFGIPGQTPDNFLHAYKVMRLGASVRNGDGSVLEFIRRKGTRNTLLALDGEAPLDDSALDPYLAGLNEERFASLFAIDHDELVKGGRGLVQGEGHLGQALFATGSGLSGLLDVQRKLLEEMEALFKPGGSKPAINAGLSRLSEAVKTLKDAALPSTEWVTHKEAYENALKDLSAVNVDLERHSAERHRLVRLQEALPLLAERGSCRAGLETLIAVVALPEGFTEKRIKANADLDTALAAEKAGREAIEAIDGQVEALVVPEELLAEAEAIEQVREGLAGYRKGQADLPRLRGEAQQFEAEARATLLELRPDLTLDDSEALRLPTKQKRAIEKLGQNKAGLDAHHRRASEEIEETAAKIEEIESAIPRLEPSRNADELRAALARVRDQGDLDTLRADARKKRDQLEKQADRELKKLPLWLGTLDDLDVLPIAAVETIDRFKADWRAIDARLESLRADRESEQRKQSEAELAIEQLRLGGEVPTDDDLAQARGRRDEGWGLVRRALRGDPPGDPEIRRFAAARDLADAFEQSLVDADEIADRLRREADRVALLAGARLNLRAASDRIEALDTHRGAAEADRDALHDDWSRLWRPLGIDPLPPLEMSGWVVKQQALSARARDIRDQRAAVEVIDERIGTHRDALDQALRRLNEPEARPDEALAALRDRAQAVVDRIEGLGKTRDDLDKQRAQLARDLDAARKRAEEARAKLDAWRADWAKAVEPIGLDADTTPEQAGEVVEQAGLLLDRIKQARDLRARIATFERDAERFEVDLASLIARVAHDLDPLPRDQAARTLSSRLKDGNEQKSQRDKLLARRASDADKARAARETIDANRARLAALVREARCESVEALPEAERLSSARQAMEARLRQLDDQLLRLAGGASIEAFAAEAETIDVDLLPARIDRLSEEIDAIETKKSDLNQALGREEAELKRMDGSGRAAEAAEQAEQLRARIAADVEQYARLRLASAVLREGIERFRQKTQGPVLARAGALFAALTLGAFEDLRVDYNDRDEPVLKGVRPLGALVGVEGMSDGTADQLYLALRLAVLENYLDKHEPVPFIVDDILTRFDNARAVATLQALAELSKRTQVLFFTHHDHLRLLAEQHLAPDTLFVHRLPARPGLVEVNGR